MASILDAFGPVEGQMADALVAIVKANAPKILAEAKRLNITAEAAAVAFVKAKIATITELVPFLPVINPAIDALGAKLVAAAGGEEAALLISAETAIADFAKSHGG